MRILIVDDDRSKYNHIIKYLPQFVDSKDDTYKLLQVHSYDILFINTRFNEDFVTRIRNIDPYIPLYLVNLINDGKCMVEYASLIDGYLITTDQIEQKIEKYINLKKYVNA